MSATNIAKADPSLANRYLTDQVTDVERATIENELICDPEFVRELEATARFKVGLHHLRETGRLDGAMHPQSSRARYGVAAGVLIALLGAIVFVKRDDRAPVLASSAADLVGRGAAPLPLASTHAVFRRRSTSFDAVIDLPPQRGVVQVRVMPDMGAQAAPFQVALILLKPDGTTEPVASIPSLHPAEDGFISVFADSTMLLPGEYRLTVSGTQREPTPPAPESFLIRVQPAGAPR